MHLDHGRHLAASNTGGWLKGLFDSDSFMPHGHCYTWDPGVVWLHVVSDGLVALAYYSIPVALTVFMVKRRDTAYRWMYGLFALFILACGTTHLMNIVTVWNPVYRLDGLVKAITAACSVVTAVLLWPLIPRAVALASPAQLRAANQRLEQEVAERRIVEAELREARETLEAKVADRAAEASEANAHLQAEIAERRRAESELREALAAVEASNRELIFFKYALDEHAIVAITDGRGRITYVNDKFCQISKYSRKELIGQDHRIINSGHHPKEFFRAMYATIARGQTWHGEIRNRAKDGSIYWVDTTIVPFMSDDGRVDRYVAIRADITEHKRVEEELRARTVLQTEMLEREKMLMRELNHRVRNNLAGLLGLVRLYERSRRDGPAIGEAIRGMVRAMKEVHDIIAESRGRVALSELVHNIAAFMVPEDHSGAAVISGPPVVIAPAQATATAIVLQELFTNSHKYGALSSPGGSVDIRWSVGDNNGAGRAPGHGRPLTLRWTERGGPPVEKPAQFGVGLQLVQGFSRSELGGDAEFDFDPAGFRCTITLSLLEPAAAA